MKPPNNKPRQKKTDNQSTLESLAEAYRELSPYLNIGYMLVAAVLLMTFIGNRLDQWWETSPWLTLVGALLGIAVGFYQFFKVVLKSSENKQHQ